MSLKRKDLLGIKDLEVEEINLILSTAESFKEVGGREIKKVPTLRGRTVVNLFFEPSTRTRASFELAAKRLSADVINISAGASSAVKGESLMDTAKNLEAMGAGPAGAGAPGLGHQRGRRRPRAPHPGAAGPVHDPGTEGAARRPDGRDRGRRPAQPGRTLQSVGGDQARRAGAAPPGAAGGGARRRR